jgi:uncharacterized membrane protein
MTLAPLTSASLPIQLHVALLLTAIVLTPLQFILQKGTFRHRLSGYVWTFCMMVGAAISFWIPSHLPFNLWGYSPIHLLSILTLVMVPIAINHARNRQIRAHRLSMMSISIFALLITGLFTLAPGRIMYRMLFAGV